MPGYEKNDGISESVLGIIKKKRKIREMFKTDVLRNLSSEGI
jgi:hypothetical protein